jgi:multidrug efflux system membrane fusion protein
MTKLPLEQNHLSSSSRKRWIWITIVVVAVVVILGGLHARRGAANGAGAAGRGRRGQNNQPSQPVMVQAAAIGDLNIYLEGLGTVVPLANVTLRAQIAGQLMEVDFKEGQLVKQGDLLAVIDPRPYEVAIQQAHGQLVQAQAQLQDAQINLTRYEKLSQQDSISTQQVDTQRALVSQYTGQVEADLAAINSAKLNLSYCHVTAPVAGRVGFRQIDPGNYVTPGDANGLVVLTQVKPTTVIFTLSEDNVPDVAARLHSGAVIPIDAYDRTQTRKLASGTLATIDNQVDATTGTFKLRALFPNDDESLFPNQFVNVRMLLDIDRGATVIPASAIERGQPGTFVYIVKPDNTVTARPVKLGQAEGERVAVLSGLAVGERVVIDGADKLKEGMPVTTQGPDSPDSSGPPAPKPAGI